MLAIPNMVEFTFTPILILLLIIIIIKTLAVAAEEEEVVEDWSLPTRVNARSNALPAFSKPTILPRSDGRRRTTILV
jgi:hypothetical protein